MGTSLNLVRVNRFTTTRCWWLKAVTCSASALPCCAELGLTKQIEVRNGGGVPDLYNYLAVLPAVSDFDKVTSLGVVCDTETDPVAAFNNLCNALQQAGLPVPAAVLQPTSASPIPRVTIALLPDAATPGMLETLLWRFLAPIPVSPASSNISTAFASRPEVHSLTRRKHAFTRILPGENNPGYFWARPGARIISLEYFPFSTRSRASSTAW